jgi:hypothetical protein
MTRDDIIHMAREANLWMTSDERIAAVECFAAIVAAEKEQQMIRDGWRQCAKGQRTTQYCGLLDAAVKDEREACATVCEKLIDTFSSSQYKTGQPWSSIGERFAVSSCADAIRARGEVCPAMTKSANDLNFNREKINDF